MGSQNQENLPLTGYIQRNSLELIFGQISLPKPVIE